LVFGALSFFQDFLRRFLLVPEMGIGNAFFERFELRAVLLGVKDNSGPG